MHHPSRGWLSISEYKKSCPTFAAILIPPVVQSIRCLTADTCLTADPGVVSSILTRSHTFMEVDHEIIARAILVTTTDSRRVAVN